MLCILITPSLLRQDQDSEHCVQRFQQRAGAYQHDCEGLHCVDRCHAVQGLVREALRLQDRCQGRRDPGGSVEGGGKKARGDRQGAEETGVDRGAEGGDRAAGVWQDPGSHQLASRSERTC